MQEEEHVLRSPRQAVIVDDMELEGLTAASCGMVQEIMVSL